MKHRGPGGSLNPAHMAARAQARAAHGAHLAAQAAQASAAERSLSASAAAGTEPWQIGTDAAGRLVAHHQPSGTHVVLAAPPNTKED